MRHVNGDALAGLLRPRCSKLTVDLRYSLRVGLYDTFSSGVSAALAGPAATAASVTDKLERRVKRMSGIGRLQSVVVRSRAKFCRSVENLICKMDQMLRRYSKSCTAGIGSQAYQPFR